MLERPSPPFTGLMSIRRRKTTFCMKIIHVKTDSGDKHIEQMSGRRDMHKPIGRVTAHLPALATHLPLATTVNEWEKVHLQTKETRVGFYVVRSSARLFPSLSLCPCIAGRKKLGNLRSAYIIHRMCSHIIFIIGYNIRSKCSENDQRIGFCCHWCSYWWWFVSLDGWMLSMMSTVSTYHCW